MGRLTLLELTCDINPSHPAATVAGWDQATRLGWATGDRGDRCPACAAPPVQARVARIPAQRAAEPETADRAAWAGLYERYADMVFRFVYFRVGNRPLAEDLTSDTFLRAFRGMHRWEDRGLDIGAWLVTIARNLVADHFKSGRYRLEVTTGDMLDADREDRGPEGSPESAAISLVTNTALLAAVEQLNPEQRECIVLRFLQGFSVAETAQAMGKNEGAIKALQFRAVRLLAQMVDVADSGIRLRRSPRRAYGPGFADCIGTAVAA